MSLNDASPLTVTTRLVITSRTLALTVVRPFPRAYGKDFSAPWAEGTEPKVPA
jgi:hypothetical protein